MALRLSYRKGHLWSAELGASFQLADFQSFSTTVVEKPELLEASKCGCKLPCMNSLHKENHQALHILADLWKSFDQHGWRTPIDPQSHASLAHADEVSEAIEMLIVLGLAEHRPQFGKPSILQCTAKGIKEAERLGLVDEDRVSEHLRCRQVRVRVEDERRRTGSRQKVQWSDLNRLAGEAFPRDIARATGRIPIESLEFLASD